MIPRPPAAPPSAWATTTPPLLPLLPLLRLLWRRRLPLLLLPARRRWLLVVLGRQWLLLQLLVVHALALHGCCAVHAATIVNWVSGATMLRHTSNTRWWGRLPTHHRCTWMSNVRWAIPSRNSRSSRGLPWRALCIRGTHGFRRVAARRTWWVAGRWWEAAWVAWALSAPAWLAATCWLLAEHVVA